MNEKDDITPGFVVSQIPVVLVVALSPVAPVTAAVAGIIAGVGLAGYGLYKGYEYARKELENQ